MGLGNQCRIIVQFSYLFHVKHNPFFSRDGEEKSRNGEVFHVKHISSLRAAEGGFGLQNGEVFHVKHPFLVGISMRF